jgi:hypothetical protein
MTNRRNAASTDRETVRVPVSGNRDVLTVKGKEDGYVYRWVNDTDDRLYKFEQAGYEHVDHDVKVGISSVNKGNSVGKTVSKNVGKGTTSHLMRIKQEWYDEDQNAKQKQISETEAVMKRQLNSGIDGQYGKVKIE